MSTHETEIPQINSPCAVQADEVISNKEQKLSALLRDMASVIVAYSGGVDSSYLAYVATRELGHNAICITGESASLPSAQREMLRTIGEQFSLNHELIETNELDNANYVANDGSRCYFCKDELYSRLSTIAERRGVAFIVDGSTLDDVGDYRPGRVAAAEHAVRSPLIEAGMTKSDVRQLSARAGLPTWDQPASPCLSSRIAYGLPVTIERLSEVDHGEQILRELGFKEFRVRHHDNLVRLEIARAEMPRALNIEIVDELGRRFRELGFKYVTFDLNGFRSGAMNEALPPTTSEA
ncbi:MAG TPA: ATP-dependent sacrificial sulfur transferase LarE [Pyrinomonadaceae bacterium]|nr:ATP-dependent sacrificial sulfur transferase LarE [Pyrinomonadaceae bacterium]